MRRMQDDMDRLFGRLFTATGGAAVTPAGDGWSPGMDISESDKEWCIEADLPGVDRENIEVQIRNRNLILRAELRPQPVDEQQEEGGRRYHRQERRYGGFEQVLTLPENVEEGEIRCEFRNGVLTVHIPKKEHAPPASRRIPVQESAAGKAPAMTASKNAASPGQTESGEKRAARQQATSVGRSERTGREAEEEDRETVGRRPA
jgi:HSP20 family protein